MEENVEKVVEETTQDQTVETVDESKFKSAGDDSVVKVDLNKPLTKKEEVKEEPKEEVVEKVKEEVKEEIEKKQEEVPVLEEVTEEEVKDEAQELTEELMDAKIEEVETGKKLPENLQKVVDFMEETGGTLEDYVRLNQDFASYDDMTVLREYYKQTKQHLTSDEVEFLIEDTFMAGEDDSERAIKKKKIALKEQVANAKAHLDGQKSKYYEEVKAGSKLTS